MKWSDLKPGDILHDEDDGWMVISSCQERLADTHDVVRLSWYVMWGSARGKLATEDCHIESKVPHNYKIIKAQ